MSTLNAHLPDFERVFVDSRELAFGAMRASRERLTFVDSDGTKRHEPAGDVDPVKLWRIGRNAGLFALLDEMKALVPADVYETLAQKVMAAMQSEV